MTKPDPDPNPPTSTAPATSLLSMDGFTRSYRLIRRSSSASASMTIDSGRAVGRTGIGVAPTARAGTGVGVSKTAMLRHAVRSSDSNTQIVKRVFMKGFKCFSVGNYSAVIATPLRSAGQVSVVCDEAISAFLSAHEIG